MNKKVEKKYIDGKDYVFPDKFMWGTGTAALQIEGKNRGEIREEDKWEYWFRNAKYRFYKKEFTKNDFLVNYKDDIKLAKESGIDSFRISILWARFMNRDGSINQEGLNYYNNVINELINNDITPIVTLNHFDMPMWLQEQGGLLERKFTTEFEKYAIEVFKAFGDRVKMWYTFNEPGYVFAAYLYGKHYPNKRSFKDAWQAQYHIVIAHKMCVKALNELFPGHEIGMVINVSKAMPRDPDNKDDVEAAKWNDLFDFKCYTEPTLKGKYPKQILDELDRLGYSIKRLPEDEELIKNHISNIQGLNFYQPHRVMAPPYIPNFKSSAIGFEHYYLSYEMPGRQFTSDRGREVYPKALYDTLMFIKDEYKNIKTLVCENGLGIMNEDRFRGQNGQIKDDYRIEFLAEHIAWIHKAIEDGSNCVGYHMWTYIDNWSWINAYKNRYGLIELDTDTGKRIPKLSASWFKDLSITNTLKWKEIEKNDF